MNDTVSTLESGASKLSGKTFNIIVGVAAALTVLAVALWAFEMVNGMAETNMRNLVPWGLGIIGFMFFVGLSAGALAAGAVPLVGDLKKFKPASKVAIWLSLACVAGAAFCIMSDIGNPQRTLEMVFEGNLSSPLMWDMIALALYVVMLVVLIAMLCKGSGEGAVRGVAALALVAMVFLQVVEAGIFASYNAHEYWATPLMYPWFITTALACGTGLVVAVCVGLSKAGFLAFEEGALASAAKTLGVFVTIDLCMLCLDAFMSAPSESGIVGMLTAGPLAPFFWCQVVCYVAAIALCFTGAQNKPMYAVYAGVLAVLGACFKRFCMLLGGFQVANIAYEGQMTADSLINWQNGMTAAYSQLVYMPSVGEIGLLVGVFGLVALIAVVGWRFLPLSGE